MRFSVVVRGYPWHQSRAVLQGEELNMCFVFRSASASGATNPLGDYFIFVDCHILPEKFALMRIEHSMLTRMSSTGRMVWQVYDTFAQRGGYNCFSDVSTVDVRIKRPLWSE